MIILSIIAVFMVILIYFWPRTYTRVWTNDKQTIIFEGMCHIGKTSYYNNIKIRLRAYKNDGYSYFYERVKKSGIDKTLLNKKLMGMDFGDNSINDLYNLIAKLSGLDVQPQSSFLGILNNDDHNIDASEQELLDEIDRLGISFSEIKTIPFPNSEKDKEAIEVVSKSRITHFIMKSFLFIMIGMKFLFNSKKFHSVEPVVVDFRDDILANAILNGPKNIYITYGEGHAKGVYKRLIAKDNSWQEISKTANYFI